MKRDFYHEKKVDSLANEIILKLKDLLMGKYEDDFLKKRMIPIILIAFITFYAIAWLLYPPFYNPAYNEVSNLGNPVKNPLGWISWTVGMIITGFLFLPAVPFIARKLYSGHFIKKMFTILGTGLMYMSITGMILVGAIPQFQHINPIFLYIHYINALLAFGGLYLGMFVWWISILLDSRFRTKKLMIPATICGWFTPIGVSISILIRFNAGIPDNAIWFLNIAFWEWNLLIFGFAALACLAFLTLDKDEM